MLDELTLEEVLVDAQRRLPAVRPEAAGPAAEPAAREPGGRVLEQLLVDHQLLMAEIRDLDASVLRPVDQLPVKVLAHRREHGARSAQRARVRQVVLQLLAPAQQCAGRATGASGGNGASGGAGARTRGHADAEARVRSRREHLPHVVLELLQETIAAIIVARR